MNKLIKSALLSGLIQGVVFALIMGIFDYAEGKELLIGKILLQILIFGTFTGLLNYFTLKRKAKRENQQK